MSFHHVTLQCHCEAALPSIFWLLHRHYADVGLLILTITYLSDTIHEQDMGACTLFLHLSTLLPALQ
jgi:hypothetical protein